jgi:DNA mismatch repair protein MutS
MSLIKEYLDLTKKYQDEYGENTILLMMVGAFFEVYGIYNKETDTIVGSKILAFSQICELNVVDKNVCVGDNNVVMAGFKDFQIDKYIKKIQDAGFTVVVYTQDENVKNTTRSLAGVFSPGTYFHNESQRLSNSITCIWVNFIENKIVMKGKYVVVGVANIDIYTGKTTIFQFKEIYVNNPTTYDELERFISIYNPSEVIVISNLQNEREIDHIISYAGITCNLIHKININNVDLLSETKAKNVKNCEKQPYQKEILSRFYTFDNFEIFIQNFNENIIATQALCYLLDFVYQHNPQLINKISEPVFETTSKRLTLANHSLKQLNMINDGNVKPTKYSCISQMLNDCLTPMGKRKFLYNILNPITNEEELNREYNITEHVIQHFQHFEKEMKNRLMQMNDLSKLERQVILKKIAPKALYSLHKNLSMIADIFQIVKEDAIIMEYLKTININTLEIGNYCYILNEFIDKNIDVQIAKEIENMQNFEINFIKKGVDNELDKVSGLLSDSEAALESIKNYLSSLIENKEKKNSKTNDFVKIDETEKNNYSLLCTSRRCKLLQDALPPNNTEITLYAKLQNPRDNTIITKPFVFNVSKTQFTYEAKKNSNNIITDSQINNYCKNISYTKITMKDIIALVFNRIVEQLGNYQKELEGISEFITMIDVLYTKANIAKKFNYCKPTIVSSSEKSFVKANALRHCLIEQFKLNELYVSNDIELGDGRTDGILLYGTNAVGKTTLIRALGVAIIMAQAGLYVPCSSFHYKPYTRIFTRIIGNDNIFKGQSTFEVEMSELRTILRFMDRNSLILGDELCSGTETISAISIFVAGIQKMHNSGSSFIFATHLHEIVNYEEIKRLTSVHLKHMAVVYNKELDTLVYDRKLKDGPGANMYGLEVCKSLSLPQEFLDMANEIRLKYNTEGKSILSLKQSRYNSNKLVSLCEKCGRNMGTEVHHLQHQADANDEGIITTNDSVFHKNNLANLMTLCESCHNEVHKKNVKQKKVKTSKGVKVVET